jgi:hypothetical protein
VILNLRADGSKKAMMRAISTVTRCLCVNVDHLTLEHLKVTYAFFHADFRPYSNHLGIFIVSSHLASSFIPFDSILKLLSFLRHIVTSHVAEALALWNSHVVQVTQPTAKDIVAPMGAGGDCNVKVRNVDFTVLRSKSLRESSKKSLKF